MSPERLTRGAITIIGKAGRGPSGCGPRWIEPLWQAANRDFDEISQFALRGDDGKPVSLWGAMRNGDGSFRPWEAEGRYLAGAEVQADAAAPEGWEKWVLPACEWLAFPCTAGSYSTVFQEAVDLLRERGYSLCGAVQERYDPRREDGSLWLWFPVKRLDE